MSYPNNVITRSHVFAQKMRWYLESYCVGSPAYTSPEKTHRVRMLIDEISERGLKPSFDVLNSKGFGEIAKKEVINDQADIANEDEALLVSHDDGHYQTFNIKSLDLETGEICANPFELNMSFSSQLASISSRLRNVPSFNRNEKVCI